MGRLDEFPIKYLSDAIMRISVVYYENSDRIDFGTKTGFMREIHEMTGDGFVDGIIDRVIRLYDKKLIGEKEVKAVIDHFESLWNKVLKQRKK